ncbi:MAG TPA: site-2 protease family protein [Longimicrobium sp.]|nr:site-2 protease family protein [Longimicrobium sp.]
MDFDLQRVLTALPVLLLSLTAHEFAHAWMAMRQGDDTAYMLGRVTLDPRAHLDPIGSLLFPIVGIGTGMPLLGWAKPVPTNPRKYRSFKRGDILVSLAGVMANAVLAVLFALLVLLFVLVVRGMEAPPQFVRTLFEMLLMGVFANVGLIFFNLLPIPPLDGSHVFYYLLPPNLGASYRQLQPYGMLILWGLVLFGGFNWLGGIISVVAGVLLLPANMVAG